MNTEQLWSFLVEDLLFDELYEEDVNDSSQGYIHFANGTPTSVRIPKLPCRTRPFTGDHAVNEMLNGHLKRGYHHFVIENTSFMMLKELLVSRGFLASTKYVSAREQLAIFLFAIRRDETNRDIQEEFQHSGETISRHFMNVLRAICSLSDEFIVLPGEDVGVHHRVRDSRRFYPYFANALGAVDGTHIPAHVPKSKAVSYRNRKGFLSQNVMAAASFDHTFLFVCAGWEGSAWDMKILR